MQICTTPGQIAHAAAEVRAEFTALQSYFFDVHAYCCEFDNGAIILDLRSDTYLGLDAQHIPYLRTRISNWPESGESGRISREADPHDIAACESLIVDLLTRGILTTSLTSRQPSPAAIPTTALTPASSAEAQRRIPLTHVIQFSIALLMVVLHLKGNRLAVLLDWLRRRQSLIQRRHSITHGSNMAQLASFLWLRTWCYTAQRRCLFDSLILAVYLTRGMIPCTFTIGVATKPFLAHAWVQIGDSVLNDTAEHAQGFKPIFSVGDA
jgi:hypothetical protein